MKVNLYLAAALVLATSSLFAFYLGFELVGYFDEFLLLPAPTALCVAGMAWCIHRAEAAS